MDHLKITNCYFFLICVVVLLPSKSIFLNGPQIVWKNRYEANTNLDSNMSKHILHVILDIKDAAMFWRIPLHPLPLHAPSFCKYKLTLPFTPLLSQWPSSSPVRREQPLLCCVSFCSILWKRISTKLVLIWQDDTYFKFYRLIKREI